MPFFDGDDFHPAANKQKMAAGVPLTDTDREPWLARLGELLAGKDDSGTGVPPSVACSALKRRYRDLLRRCAPDVVFVHLAGTAATIGARMDARSHEFMPRALLESQYAALEDLAADEAHVRGDITQPLDILVEMLELKLKLAEQSRLEPKLTLPEVPSLREAQPARTRSTGHRSHVCQD
jgi:gluconokinase